MMKMRRLKTALKTLLKNVGMDWCIDKEGEASDGTNVAAKRAPCTKKAVIGSKSTGLSSIRGAGLQGRGTKRNSKTRRGGSSGVFCEIKGC